MKSLSPRSRLASLACVLLAGASFGSDSPKGYDGATARNELEGTWERVSAAPAGGKAVIALPGECVETFRHGRWVYRHKGRIGSEGVYRTDSSRQPAHLDESTTAENEAG